jgi:hypothetical protein
MESITDSWDMEKCATLKGLHLEVSTPGATISSPSRRPEIPRYEKHARAEHPGRLIRFTGPARLPRSAA